MTSPSENRSRRLREKEAHRRDIVEAAERVFAEKGFESTTMDDVAREAEFSVGALYTFFANKDVLLGEVIGKIGRDFLEAFQRETAAAAGPLEALVALIRLRLVYAHEHAAFLRVLIEARLRGRGRAGGCLPGGFQGVYDDYLDRAAALFKAAMNQGLLRRADPAYAALSLEGAIIAFRAYWARRGITLPLHGQVALVRRHLLTPLVIKKGKKTRHDDDTV